MKCLFCQRDLRKAPYREGYGYSGHGLFCTLRCGYDYAVAAIRSGRVQ